VRTGTTAVVLGVAGRASASTCKQRGNVNVNEILQLHWKEARTGAEEEGHTYGERNKIYRESARSDHQRAA